MFPFQIIIDDSFININTDDQLGPIDKKFVLSFANGFEEEKWRFDKFQKYIWDNVAESALSFRERDSLVGNPSSLLAEAAKKLRLTDKVDDISKGSELAEIVLYGIMKYHFNALPVVPKIFYKQNAQDNAKGADSVHIVIENDNDFSIWFGEAKFYNSIEDARLYDIIDSVKNSLETTKLKKENSIITDVSDIDFLITDAVLRESIRRTLNTQESIDVLKPKLHIPILLLHECEITSKAKTIDSEYIESIVAYHKDRAQSYFKKQIRKCKDTIHLYSEISFHIILFPVPKKAEIVYKFIEAVEFHKNQ